ncbi:hypothetical protein METHPM2_1360007 [Pseudomonas sp. PM2]
MNLVYARSCDRARGLPGAFITLMVRGWSKNLRYTAGHFFVNHKATSYAKPHDDHWRRVWPGSRNRSALGP